MAGTTVVVGNPSADVQIRALGKDLNKLVTDELARFPVAVFDDRRLIAYYRLVFVPDKMSQLFIVRDLDSIICRGVNLYDVYAYVSPLLDGLFCHAQRRNDKGLFVTLRHMVGPFNLH